MKDQGGRDIKVVHIHHHHGTNWGRVLFWCGLVILVLWLLLVYLASQTLMGQP
jgi:hypothetical protein